MIKNISELIVKLQRLIYIKKILNKLFNLHNNMVFNFTYFNIDKY